MKRYIKSLSGRFLSSGEREALRQFIVERKVAKYNRQGLRLLQAKSWMSPSHLNLGSGSDCKKGYLNVDLFPGCDVTLDLRRGLPFETNCCEVIISEHFFEHLDYPQPAQSIFRECFRVLKPGGMLRFSVPDTEWPITEYAEGKNSSYFQACEEHPWWHPDYCTTLLEHINHHFRQGGEHRFAYDEETARKVLEAAGFHEIERCTFDADLDSSHREVGSLILSARKPVQT